VNNISIHIYNQLAGCSRRVVQMKKTRKLDSGGFTLVEIMIVVAIIGLLAAISIPSFLHARNQSQSVACINNLGQMESACQQLATANNLGPGATINFPDDLTPYIKLNASSQLPPCPAGGVYSELPVGANPQSQCSLGSLAVAPHALP
jgi:prepilin-type N-terminal cleavage/methylation domain-containing protein